MSQSRILVNNWNRFFMPFPSSSRQCQALKAFSILPRLARVVGYTSILYTHRWSPISTNQAWCRVISFIEMYYIVAVGATDAVTTEANRFSLHAQLAGEFCRCCCDWRCSSCPKVSTTFVCVSRKLGWLSVGRRRQQLRATSFSLRRLFARSWLCRQVWQRHACL